MAYTHIDPGREIEISTRLYSSKDQDRITELVKLPRTELGELEEASVAREKAIFSKFSEIEAEWRKTGGGDRRHPQGKAISDGPACQSYLQSVEKDQYGNYERSNRVYKMTYRFYDRTHYDRTKQETVTDAWYLSWHLHYNTICNPTPDLTGDGWQLAGQSDKRFTEKADMERYLQGRIKAYAHLFTEVSPPIPKGQEGRFSVNGVLLPGYTVEASLEERVEEMLSFLEDDPALLEEPLSSGHQDTPQEEEPTMAQKLHTTPLNQHRNRESVQSWRPPGRGPRNRPAGKRPRYGDSGTSAAVRASMAF